MKTETKLRKYKMTEDKKLKRIEKNEKLHNENAATFCSVVCQLCKYSIV